MYKILKKAGSVKLESNMTINSSCAKVWGLLYDLNSWSSWNKVLYLRNNLTSNLKLGDKVHLLAAHTLWYYPLSTFPINVEVSELIEGKRLVWEGKPMGAFGYHGFEISGDDKTCTLYQWEEGFGKLVTLGLELGVFDSIGRIHINFSNSLKKRAET